MGIDLAIDAAITGYPVGWFSPSYKMLLEVWRETVEETAAVTKRKSVQERRIELINGGLVDFWSLENPDAGRGRKYARVIIDEASLVHDLLSIWQSSIRPTLTDYRGDAWFWATPKGHNGFWQMYQMGMDEQQPDWQAWQIPTSENPYIDPAEIESMRQQSPEMIFQQEMLALFLDDAGGVFRRVMEAATATEQDEATDGHEYLIGVDWGQSRDFTVLAVIDITTDELCHLDRFNQIDYVVQRGRLVALCERFKPVQVIAELNAMGQPIVEQLQRDGLPVQGFMTTNATKAAAIDALALAFERGDLAVLNDPVLIGELQAYEMSKTKTGLRSFSAPAGMHDDTVMALALAYSGIANQRPSLLSDLLR
jgi:phage FluMu gp28-like protein